jgi:hypothetical protein
MTSYCGAFGRSSASAAPWCSGLTCHPVTVEIEGSNPFGVARLTPTPCLLVPVHGALAPPS